MEFGITHATIEVGLLAFCPECHVGMDRLDPLGVLEAAHRTDKPETFEEFLSQPNVLR